MASLAITRIMPMEVNYPAHRAGHLKKLDEGDCIPLPPAPHSSPSTGRGILREDFINIDFNEPYDKHFFP
jgi:hypothetical protein